MLTHLTSLSRSVGVLAVATLLAIVGGLPTASRAAASLPGCEHPGELTPGLWTGSFTVRAEWRWTGLSSDGRPVTQQGEVTVLGSFALPVPNLPSLGEATLTGRAWASWRTRTSEMDEAGDGRVVDARGWLSGGELGLTDERPLVPGARLIWQGAWWTAFPGDNLGIGFRRLEAGMAVGPVGDGPLRPQPAMPFVFMVDSVDCTSVTGSVAALQFLYPGVGLGPEPQTVAASGRFSLVLDYPARAP